MRAASGWLASRAAANSVSLGAPLRFLAIPYRLTEPAGACEGRTAPARCTRRAWRSSTRWSAQPLCEQPLGQEESYCAPEECGGGEPPALGLELGDQVRRGDVESDPARQREPM